MKNATKLKKTNKRVKVVAAEKVINLTTSPKLLAAPNAELIKTGCLGENFIDLSDSYKDGHWAMLPDETEAVYSYGESRIGATFPYTVPFGLQAILKRYFVGVVVTQADIENAFGFAKEHFGFDNVFNRKMWEHIVNVYGGRLPLKIKAAPEGMPVPINNVLYTVENTGGKITAPLTNYVESLLTHVWHPSNVATISRDLKTYFRRALEISSDNPSAIAFMLNDFGFRGVSSVESAGLGGAGHLVNFMGTDTKIAIRYAQRYYGAGMAGFSVRATEHSVMTAKGEKGELEVFHTLINKFPNGILSIVADSYNIERVVKEYLPQLKSEIMARNGKVVIRPDSPRSKEDTAAAQIIWLANELGNLFGHTINNKGYKILDSHIGIIYGDGLKSDEIKGCVKTLVIGGWAADTSVYGMGGGLLQKHNRDTQRNAFKCSAQLQNGKWIEVKKTPLDISKASKGGRLKLVWSEGAHGKLLVTVSESDPREDVLVTVFENGSIVKDWKWDEVKANAETKLLDEVY